MNWLSKTFYEILSSYVEGILSVCPPLFKKIYRFQAIFLSLLLDITPFLRFNPHLP